MSDRGEDAEDRLTLSDTEGDLTTQSGGEQPTDLSLSTPERSHANSTSSNENQVVVTLPYSPSFHGGREQPPPSDVTSIISAESFYSRTTLDTIIPGARTSREGKILLSALAVKL